MDVRQHVQRSRAAQLLSVLALLLGLLSMHGLVGGHHGPVARAVSALSGSVDRQAVAEAHGPRHGSTAPTPGAAAGPLAPVLGLPVVDGACTDCTSQRTAMLCLAVLSAGLALLARLLARRAQVGGLPAPQLRLPVLRAGPPLRLRPPDLVAQLCVSRT